MGYLDITEVEPLDNFHELIELNKLLDNTSNIVLLDDEVTYYTFNLLSTYSKFMSGLKNANINLNRKVLAELAVNDAKAFSELVKKVSK